MPKITIADNSFIKLHIAVFLAGFTGVFGKLIHLDAFVLVWYRMLLVTFFLFFILLFSKKLQKISWKDFGKMALIGSIIAIHWVTFYGSIAHSNISIGVVCFSLCGFFSALAEPLLLKKKFSLTNLLLSMIVIVGIGLIFSFDHRYRTGILYGTVSAALASVFTILNRKYSSTCSSSNMLLYQMGTGFLLLTLLSPIYLRMNPEIAIIPGNMDFLFLSILAIVCTILPFMFQIQVLRHISVFTVNLTYTMEPIYSILIAFIFFGEAREVNFAFYVGLVIIIVAVLLQNMNTFINSRSC